MATLDFMAPAAWLALLLLASAAAFTAGRITGHEHERSARLRLAAEYFELAAEWEALARRMAGDDRLRAGIDIGVDHVLSIVERHLADLREQRAARRGEVAQ